MAGFVPPCDEQMMLKVWVNHLVCFTITLYQKRKNKIFEETVNELKKLNVKGILTEKGGQFCYRIDDLSKCPKFVLRNIFTTSYMRG